MSVRSPSSPARFSTAHPSLGPLLMMSEVQTDRPAAASILNALADEWTIPLRVTFDHTSYLLFWLATYVATIDSVYLVGPVALLMC